LESNGNSIATLSDVTVTGSNVTIRDGTGEVTAFTLSPISGTTSGSENVSVGGYNLTATNQSNSNPNYTSMLTTGSLTVNTKNISVNDLAISGLTKVYNGSSNISGLALTVSGASVIKSGDLVTVLGTGSYSDANVGTAKAITINPSLTGADSGNYSLTSGTITLNSGTILQLPSVTFTGASGGTWSNSVNWNGGAIPTLSNVAQAVIPAGITVVYDFGNLTGLLPTSTIATSGLLNISSNSNLNFSNTISGTGSVSQSGSGTLTLSGVNTYSGGTNINSSSLIVQNASAIGTGAVTSSSGSFSLASGVVLPNLTVNGPITLSSDITTTGAQVYNGEVTLGSGNAVSGTVTPMVLSTTNSNITFASTLVAGNSALLNKQSVTIDAGTGQVTFGDSVGSLHTVNDDLYSVYASRPGVISPYQLIVTGGTIIINANITTFETQTYNGAVLIGDNVTNGNTRVLLSLDPKVTFNGTVDDTIANTHTLIVKAVSITGGETPEVTFTEAVGDTKPLASLTVLTGRQDIGNKFSETFIPSDQYIGTVNIGDNVTTFGDQIYTGNTIDLSNATAQTFTTTDGGDITFNRGTVGGGINSAGNLSFALNGGSLAGLNGISYTEIAQVINAPAQSSQSQLNLDSGALHRNAERTMAMPRFFEESKTVGGGDVSVVFCGENPNSFECSAQ
jgi:autotransporter-associated beta strand protein